MVKRIYTRKLTPWHETLQFHILVLFVRTCYRLYNRSMLVDDIRFMRRYWNIYTHTLEYQARDWSHSFSFLSCFSTWKFRYLAWKVADRNFFLFFVTRYEPITVRWILEFLVGLLAKSTRHLYSPPSLSSMWLMFNVAGSVTVLKKARSFKWFLSFQCESFSDCLPLMS